MEKMNILDVIMEADIESINDVLKRLAAEHASHPATVQALEIAAYAVLFAHSEAVHTRFAKFLRETTGEFTDEQREEFRQRLRALGIPEEGLQEDQL